MQDGERNPDWPEGFYWSEAEGRPVYRLHYVWDYENNTGVCWCGENHADDQGRHGPIADDKWTSISDPKAQAALDDLYAEAWLGGERD